MSGLKSAARAASLVGATPRQARAEGRLFSPMTAVWVVLVGVFSFSALMVLLAYAPDLKTGNDGDAHALSKSAVGYAAVVEAMRLTGEPVLIMRAKAPKGRREGLLIAAPYVTATPKTIELLGFQGPVLVILPKWLTAPNPLHKGWISQAQLIDPKWPTKDSLMAPGAIARRATVSRPQLRAVDGPFEPGALMQAGPVTSLQSFKAKGFVPILVDETGATILARDEKRPIYVLSDPDLINTQGMKSLATMTTALSLIHTLKAGDGPVMFDVTLNGLARERSILRLLFDPPFLAVTLCLFAAAGLAGFQAFCRFGPMRRAGRVFALGKEALADNSAALIRLARREHRMGGRYAAMTRTIAAKAVGAPRELSGEPLTHFLDRMGAQRGAADKLSDLTAMADAAPDRDRLASVAQRLFRWRLEMTRERQ
ncbi:MAG TPA: hypothetical protein VFE03_15605 [Caulobacteraceae bacterium]|nr:hypothetical protein [Caulobacteraceae bacterium]